MEAMAAGVPVVQPSHGVFPEMIRDLKGGRLFDATNIDALTSQLKILLMDDESRIALGKQAREAVLTKRNARKMALATIDAISEVVQPTGV